MAVGAFPMTLHPTSSTRDIRRLDRAIGNRFVDGVAPPQIHNDHISHTVFGIKRFVKVDRYT